MAAFVRAVVDPATLTVGFVRAAHDPATLTNLFLKVAGDSAALTNHDCIYVAPFFFLLGSLTPTRGDKVWRPSAPPKNCSSEGGRFWSQKL